MERLLQKIIRIVFLLKVERAEKIIGYKLSLGTIPSRFIDGWVSWDETATWKKFGIDLEIGINYWTIGKTANGVSSRFDRTAPEYQSWLGGYLVKLASPQSWTVEDHFKLAIADQNSWLKTYGDPRPTTTIEGWTFNPVDTIRTGQYSGTLYKGGCTTHSDSGGTYKKIKFLITLSGIAALFNASNPNLRLKGTALKPQESVDPYETLKLRGYIAIFDVEENIKVVLYGNGAIIKQGGGDIDTFAIIKNDLLEAMRSCKIVKL